MAGIAVKIAATPTALAGSRPPRAQRVLVRSATLCRSRDSGVAGRDSVIASRLVISVFFFLLPPQFRHRFQKIQAIPLNTQKFKCIYINRMILMDSTAFLPASLDDLAKTLKASDHHFPILRQWEGLEWRMGEEDVLDAVGGRRRLIDVRRARLEMAQRKGVFPYDHVRGGDVQMKAEKELPPKEAFFNRLSGAHISEEEYAFAQRVWRVFGCRNMMDYTTMYMEIDTYLLAEAVMNMRKTLYDEFELDMCQYLSLPMMAKDIMLKVTDAKIGLISDYDMVLLIQRGIRGGMSYIGQRLAELDVTFGERSGGDDNDKTDSDDSGGGCDGSASSDSSSGAGEGEDEEEGKGEKGKWKEKKKEEKKKKKKKKKKKEKKKGDKCSGKFARATDPVTGEPRTILYVDANK